jgi:hypothetical protein
LGISWNKKENKNEVLFILNQRFSTIDDELAKEQEKIFKT